MAPMVHWPEVMVTFDTTDGILYSADAFGTFGALAGNVFADEVDLRISGLMRPEDIIPISSANTVRRFRWHLRKHLRLT